MDSPAGLERGYRQRIYWSTVILAVIVLLTFVNLFNFSFNIRVNRFNIPNRGELSPENQFPSVIQYGLNMKTSDVSTTTQTPDGQCPKYPPGLIGRIEVDLANETISVVERRLEPFLLAGGNYEPTECKAKDRVAIIIPYRDREEQLPILLKNLHPMLMRQQINYGIFVVEQTKSDPFNRASLMNVGFAEANKLGTWDCFIFHDVDLIPLDDRNLYTCSDQPRHMSVAIDKFNYK